MMRVVKRFRDALQRVAAIVAILRAAETHADGVGWIAVRRERGARHHTDALITQLQRQFGCAPVAFAPE